MALALPVAPAREVGKEALHRCSGFGRLNKQEGRADGLPGEGHRTPGLVDGSRVYDLTLPLCCPLSASMVECWSSREVVTTVLWGE